MALQKMYITLRKHVNTSFYLNESVAITLILVQNSPIHSFSLKVILFVDKRTVFILLNFIFGCLKGLYRLLYTWPVHLFSLCCWTYWQQLTAECHTEWTQSPRYSSTGQWGIGCVWGLCLIWRDFVLPSFTCAVLSDSILSGWTPAVKQQHS